MPKISVIVPVHNTEKYLKKSIDSLINQTLDDIEIILIDDASTDNSLEIMKAYQRLHPKKIKIITSKENIGPAGARNLGLEIATGRYIGFLDSDDYVSPTMYDKMVTACEKTSSELARTNRKIVFRTIDFTFLGRQCTYEDKIINQKTDPRFLVNEPPCVTNKIFKSSLLENSRFPEKLKWEDYPFAIDMMIKANQIASVSGYNYFYNMHINSTTCSDARKLNKNMLDIFECSDMVAKTCVDDTTCDNIKYLINYVQIQNCLQRLKEILNVPIPLQEKKELLTLFSSLIKTKYGNWQSHEIYQEQKKSSLVHGVRMELIEKLLLPEVNIDTEEGIKEKIKIKLDKYTK